jgi:ATP-dependent protease HslVU (ClpYQ) peptidase subunit
MTVCIAARCGEGAIFVAADRLVTVGDMEMEHPVEKVMNLPQSIMILPSDDDAAFHAQILLDVYTTAKQRVEADPKRRLTVQEILDLYIETRQAHKMRRAERDILKPLGLYQSNYLAQQKSLDPDLVKQIAVDLINYKIPHLTVIVVVIDPTGSHIFIADTQYDSIGYAAIGAGGRHANAQFLMAGHTWHTPLPEALWNTYLAKKTL